MDKIIHEKLFEKIKLKNGLDLLMFYRSKHVAGDRFHVIFKAVVNVEIKPDYLEGYDLQDIGLEDLPALLGNKTSYNYKKECNFIAEHDEETVPERMKDDFLKANLRYLSSPRFLLGVIKKNYRDLKPKMLLLKI